MNRVLTLSFGLIVALLWSAWGSAQQVVAAEVLSAGVAAVEIAAARVASPEPQEPMSPEATPDDAAASAKPAASAPLKAPPALNAPAKQVFGGLTTPSSQSPHVIGFYAKGCLAGGVALPIDGETWQVMRVSRNRNWGHPALLTVLEELSRKVGPAAGWPGLMVGDIAQPRGGPMLTGHASHQVGLDADIWLTPMPKRRLSSAERETIVPTNVVAADWNDVDPKVWSPAYGKVLRAAAEIPAVERIFINPAIKKALCREAGSDRAWLNKVRPMYGHNYHFHVRIKCPAGEADCKPQAATQPGDGCGADLAYWFSDAVRKPKPPPKTPVKPAPPLPLSALPADCRQVAIAP